MSDPVPLFFPSQAIPAGGYSRSFDVELDLLDDGNMRVRGVQSDSRHGLAYDWVVSFPDYQIIKASAEDLSGDASVLSPELLSRCIEIQGAYTSQGFMKKVVAMLGDLPGYREHLALALEMARACLQGFPVPKDDHKRFEEAASMLPPGPGQIARMAWERDRVDWSWLCNSCYAYRDESASLFAEREVKCFDLDLMSPHPGQERFFWRGKRLQVSEFGAGNGFYCRNEMNDTFHELDISFDLQLDGTISSAESQWQRLAFEGICDDTQLLAKGLVGERLDSNYARALAGHVGGRSGCTHLYDLATDCLRMFEWP
ncbi:MAG: hypothetical protein CMQ19_03720 [Gammaproteobacteria bacterium]|nr:hypothetical protein [Gammaproteobacteria bacterium]